MSVLDQLNGSGIYLVCGGIVLFIACIIDVQKSLESGGIVEYKPKSGRI